MQAASNMPRFKVGRFGFVILIASVVLNVALGALALAQAGHVPSIGREEQVAPRLVARYQPNMGEGLVGNALDARSSAPRAYLEPYMGEGRLNVRREASTPAAPFVPGQGEGWVGNGASRNAAHDCGQGEGLVQLAIPIENPCETR